mmetsp:Transcript_17884/g.32009  ORF Transcript_17884/g.32009 Transcript_17884/m.32009 type:complete len:315 (-) Transcript_17884:168-1112(-)|eukprot:CAMPEP_0197539156 /NCGR_PEP_ID=MMETSP1318-20131121/61776_1 /TAXON_ID=552666 /ORGANISM="Partenskyella glossopodia, Strain RCC365" /LENGTH=314 /DNA_ID=CAMNT_0043097787 /DNA_START=235 /DNA_END=1179 /DNA_ORIENTATION=+
MEDTVTRKRKRQEEESPSLATVEKLVSSVEIVDEDENQYRVLSHKPLEEDRRAIYARRFSELDSGTILACKCEKEPEDEEEKPENGDVQIVEHLLIISKASDDNSGVDGYVARPFLTECKISYEEVSPTQLVEFCFSESPEWHLGVSTRPFLESFRRTKFGVWKNLLLTTTCKKTLRSLLALGPITHIFDRFALPTPEEHKHLFETLDENGKKVFIPHPVKSLRVWNPNTLSYDPVESRLEGSPDTKEAVADFWESILSQLRTAHGKEFIDALIKEGQEFLTQAKTKIEAAAAATSLPTNGAENGTGEKKMKSS